MDCSHSRLPVFKSKQETVRRSPSNPARNTRPRATIGEEVPLGTSVRQARFLSLPNSTGRPRVLETPEPFGPRKRGQSSGRAPQAVRDRRLMISNPPITQRWLSKTEAGNRIFLAFEQVICVAPLIRFSTQSPDRFSWRALQETNT